ncbi:hypothetical protein [Sediminibacillus sp. JSM 1682029]|uniref:hypothetical protein n=1 Tax=Sediminibacillus sp. JSM 1682029 TaxID=3229857 RepID=UPI00352494CE
MSIDAHINSQLEAISTHLKDKYNIETNDLYNFNEYCRNAMRTIISLKVWAKKLKERELILNGAIQYLDEIISNLNQTLILGLLGFKSPSYSMIRRSLENAISFIYYKDHSIEYAKKQVDTNFKNLSVKDMSDYIKQYPYHYFITDIDSLSVVEFVQQVMGLWKTQYQQLSKFVHGSNENYLELNEFLDKIEPSDENLESLTTYIKKFGSIINTLNIIFFCNVYEEEFDEDEKQFIRRAITQDSYKKKIQSLFGLI